MKGAFDEVMITRLTAGDALAADRRFMVLSMAGQKNLAQNPGTKETSVSDYRWQVYVNSRGLA